MCGRNYKKGEELWRRLGRIFLKNSEAIVKTKNKYRNEFICYTGMGWCLTNIFNKKREK